MAVNLSPLGGVGAQFFDSNGNPLSGGMIYTYAAGTSTPAATYTSSAGSIQHSNPIVLDAAGRVPTGEIWLTDGVSYKFTIKTSADVLVNTYDNIVGINSNYIAFTMQQEIQTATAGQTVFDLTTMQYQPGTNSLSVFVDGVNQYGPGAQYAYVETDSDTVTFVSGLHDGASVKFTTAASVSSNYANAAQVTYDPPFTGAVATNVEAKLSETVSVKDFGAVGDGITDDTAAIQAACAASTAVHFPNGTYNINFPTPTGADAMVTYSNQTKVTLTGDNALINDLQNYVTQTENAVFRFDACSNITVTGINYQGQPLANPSDPTTGVGYTGAIFVDLQNGCVNAEVNGTLNYLRYGIRGGKYNTPSAGYNNNIKANLNTNQCGYPVALYLSYNVNLNLYAIGSHRTAYLAGVNGGNVFAQFKNQYIAPIQVFLTDASTNGLAYPSGTSMGCSNLNIKAYDMGSTTYTANNFVGGLVFNNADPNTIYENINFEGYVKSTDTIASTTGLFLFGSSAASNGYPYAFEQTLYLRNITISGTSDHSQQTIAENSTGQIYMNTISGALGSSTHYATVDNLKISNFKYLPGSYSGTLRGCWIINPGLQNNALFENCYFGNASSIFYYISNSTSNSQFINCEMQGLYPPSNGTDLSSKVTLINSNITTPTNVNYTNKSFIGSAVAGSASFLKTKVITSNALSGAAVTVGTIPAASIVYGVNAYVKTTITGATGFEIGVGGDLTRYGNVVGTAVGTKVSAISGSTATTPLNYSTTTNLIVTATGSNFTGGVIEIAIYYIDFSDFTS